MMSAMLMFCCTLIYAQTEFSGIVVDANGDPIIGASVMEKGTSNGTISDIDGNFKLKAKSGSTLLITYIGYVGQEVKAAPNLKITLKTERRIETVERGCCYGLYEAAKGRFDGSNLSGQRQRNSQTE